MNYNIRSSQQGSSGMKHFKQTISTLISNFMKYQINLALPTIVLEYVDANIIWFYLIQ